MALSLSLCFSINGFWLDLLYFFRGWTFLLLILRWKPFLRNQDAGKLMLWFFRDLYMRRCFLHHVLIDWIIIIVVGLLTLRASTLRFLRMRWRRRWSIISSHVEQSLGLLSGDILTTALLLSSWSETTLMRRWCNLMELNWEEGHLLLRPGLLPEWIIGILIFLLPPHHKFGSRYNATCFVFITCWIQCNPLSFGSFFLYHVY